LYSSAWAEIHDVFGDGHEYDWALEGDDEADFNEDLLKPEMKYQDVCTLLHRYDIF
jgi:transcription elongation factor SPT6